MEQFLCAFSPVCVISKWFVSDPAPSATNNRVITAIKNRSGGTCMYVLLTITACCGTSNLGLGGRGMLDAWKSSLLAATRPTDA